MTTERFLRPVSLDSAREAKTVVLRCAVLNNHVQGIGISWEGDEHYVKVNLEGKLSHPTFASFPKLVHTGGGDARVVYQVTGHISGTIGA